MQLKITFLTLLALNSCFAKNEEVDQEEASSLQSITSNLIHDCRDLQNGLLIDCKFREEEIAPRAEFETTYTITYDFTCGGKPVNLGFVVGQADQQNWVQISAPFNGGNGIVATGTGYGPVTTKSFTEKFERQLLHSGCHFAVEKVDSRPSASQITRWNEKKTSVVKSISEAERAKQSSSDIAFLLSGVNLLSNLAGKIGTDLTKDQELLEQLKSALSVESQCQPQSPELPSYTCNLFAKIQLGMDKQLTSAETAILVKISKAVADTVPNATCSESTGCAPLVLASYFSPIELSIFNDVSGKCVEIANRANSDIKHYEETLIALRIELAEVEKNLAGW